MDALVHDEGYGHHYITYPKTTCDVAVWEIVTARFATPASVLCSRVLGRTSECSAMKVVLAWADHAPEHDGVKNVCYDVAFRPDGSQLVAAIGSRVLMYDAANGDLLHSLKGHKGAVYCLAYSRDGKRFASGGADKTIIVWTYKAEGILKYSHGDSIQCLSYNPVTQQLASGTASDFGIWSPEQKSVSKHRAISKVLCASWTGDGLLLAIGMYSGHIYLCDKCGNEQAIVEKAAPVWTLQWNLLQNKTSDTLAVGCWDGTLSFYDLSGKQVGKCSELGFDPCSVSYHDAKYLCVGGSRKQVLLLSKEGTQLTTLCETADWVWAVRSRPKSDFVAVGCNDGSISMLQLVFATVHGLYQERYAYRDAMTDVVIQNLISNEKVRIKCRDYIRKIAVYKGHVAIQLPNRIIVYELHGDGNSESDYRVCAKINRSLECNLLVLTSQHITLCQETNLQLYSFSGVKEREWFLESTIRYIKVCGGPSGGEGLLVGTKSGWIVQVWINRDFLVRVYRHSNAIRCLDLSAKRLRLAIVDEMGNLVVFDLQSRDICYEEKLASSVAWNTKLDPMLCYSGNGLLNIKTADFPVHRQKLQGYVVGFQGSRLFCLHHSSMQTVEVPQSTSMRQFLRKGDYQNAYRVACLGVTEMDWRQLAIEAMKGQDLKVARAGFIRIRDARFLDLLSRVNQGHAPQDQPYQLTALALAYQGKFDEAAQAYCEAGEVDKAMEMYADLRMFDKAKALAECVHNKENSNKATVQEIIQRQAEWTEETNDHETAGDMYLIAGQPEKALAILAEHGPASKLIEVARRLKKSDIQELLQCANLMHRNGLYAHAFETYTKLSDFRSILLLHIELEQWDDAFTVKKLHPDLEEDVTLPYAEWLIRRCCFDDARVTYREAGRPDLSDDLLNQLIECAVKEKRFKDAAYNSWLLSFEKLQNHNRDDEIKLKESMQLRASAEIYYAYSFIDQSINEPFRTTLPETLFNIARFLLARIPRRPTAGISIVNLLVTLARHGEQLGYHKVARDAYERLQGFRVPTSWIDKLEVATLSARARATVNGDNSLHLESSFCFCCSSLSPFVSYFNGDACSKCLQPKFWSFSTFDQLPLAEFFPAEGISHEQAMQLLHQNGNSKNCVPVSGSFLEQLDLKFHRGPVRVGEGTLSKMQISQVIVQEGSDLDAPRYFYALDSSLSLFQCPSCRHFFEQEEWDFMFLKQGCCPFCRGSVSKC